MASQIVASSSNMTVYGNVLSLFVFGNENARSNGSESGNYEENCFDGEFDNNETRDDMDFDTHVDPLLEIGGVRNTLYNSFEPNLFDNASVVDSNSDGEILGSLWTSFKPNRDINDPHFTIGMTFASKQ
nr:uncharacterized protein LOC109192291 [Ipomoea batatas]GMC69757.1 uncharacterized protein LOC109192291 [Ipomoea batatas]